VVVTCGPAQVAVEYSVAAGGFFVAPWGRTLVVEVVVGSSTIGAPGGRVAGHAHVSWVTEIETVLVH